VLAGTFAVLGTLPVTFLTEIGFAVAFGVLLDTTVVRSVLVTALNLDLGRWMWWPGKLARENARPGPGLEAAGDRVRSYARSTTALDENAGIEKGDEDRPQAFGGTRV
jgi:RND superfamily putative drug exporter